jgi:hypothetical protein
VAIGPRGRRACKPAYEACNRSATTIDRLDKKCLGAGLRPTVMSAMGTADMGPIPRDVRFTPNSGHFMQERDVR